MGGGAAGHVARSLDALDRGVEPLPVVLVGLGEPGCQPRELELFLIDPEAAANQLVEHLGAGLGCKGPLPSLHASHCTNVCLSGQALHQINFDPDNTGNLQVSGPCPNTPFPLVLARPVTTPNRS